MSSIINYFLISTTFVTESTSVISFIILVSFFRIKSAISLFLDLSQLFFPLISHFCCIVYYSYFHLKRVLLNTYQDRIKEHHKEQDEEGGGRREERKKKKQSDCWPKTSHSKPQQNDLIPAKSLRAETVTHHINILPIQGTIQW